ncbi:hypothetical protein KCTCHS21_54800 [Cohnella abietis]|uniref:Uncharacterized protein n=1 Tax=Cohnella abietis TaxID=2507935 RepID=A0A3T1DD55_9BACL|nr:hypothetical protein KCTCHS21_54800 [Cohnella abietis]
MLAVIKAKQLTKKVAREGNLSALYAPQAISAPDYPQISPKLAPDYPEISHISIPESPNPQVTSYEVTANPNGVVPCGNLALQG